MNYNYKKYVKTTRDQIPTPIEIADYLGKLFPNKGIAQSLFLDRWGYVGPEESEFTPVKNILLATTPTRQMQPILDKKYDLLINHHDFSLDFPQITYHVAMDAAVTYGHNYYFARRMGLTNVRQLGGLSVFGLLPVEMEFKDFTDLLIERQFNIDGQVWSRSRMNHDAVKSVVYCSGLGGMCLTCWRGNDLNVSTVDADVYVTGELTCRAGETDHLFNHVVELGHTNSEKPLFTWIKHYLKNRWINLNIDLAGNDIDRWGNEAYRPMREFNFS